MGNTAPPNTSPDGSQIGYLSLGPHPGVPSGLSQTLPTLLAANTVYDLSGYVGHPLGFRDDGAGNLTIYTVSLYAGSNLLNSITGTGPEASFDLFNLIYISGSAFVGSPLEIRLESNQAQTGFDAISLTAVPDGGLTALLLGMSMMGLGWMHRKMN